MVQGPFAQRSPARGLLVALLVVAGCPCEATPPEHGGAHDGATSAGGDGGDGAGDAEQGESHPEGTSSKGKPASSEEPDDPPRSQSDLPPPSSTRPSDAVRRASEPPAPCADDREPIAPPQQPPDNPFGYQRPVTGCIEGQVHFVEHGARAVPRRWSRLDEGPTLWACELNVEPHIWADGLPGMGTRYQWFAVRYEGAFRVAKAGTYGFRLRSDDGSRLLVDGELVLDNDGMHGARSRDGEVELEAGDHRLVVQYIQGAHHVALQLFVTPPDGEEGLLSVRRP